jgi:TatD DNase family protein
VLIVPTIVIKVFVDSHAHLQWNSFIDDFELVLERAKKTQVCCIVNIGFDLDSCIKGVKLANTYPELYASIGIHPHSANEFNDTTLSTLKTLATNPKVVAIGEVGLDYFRNLSTKEAQMKAFEAQLSLAYELNLPVVIHDREAHDDILKVLSKYNGKLNGIMHCFSGDIKIAQQCIDMGFLISFAGNVTYPKAYQLHEAAKYVALDNMLIETDCPFLTPQEMRGKRNEPSYLVMTANKIAALKDVSIDDVAAVTTKNAKTIYRIKN